MVDNMTKNFFVIILLFVIGCKTNQEKALPEEAINLYPNLGLIKKEYKKYTLLHPFYPSDSLYTPIQNSKKNTNKAITLIKVTDPYDLQYFDKYLINKMEGNYNDYIIQNNNILYRYYFKHFKDVNEKKIKSKKDIENYFHKNQIEFNFIKSKGDSLYFYLLKRKAPLPPSYCIVKLHDNNLETSIIYNINDTIRTLSLDALRPFLGSQIED